MRVLLPVQRSLDILVNDKDYAVRVAVAEKGYGLDKLVNDRYWQVREAVARQGYGLDQLINDTSIAVRRAATAAKLIKNEKEQRSIIWR